jgi:hypothetical protein
LDGLIWIFPVVGGQLRQGAGRKTLYGSRAPGAHLKYLKRADRTVELNLIFVTLSFREAGLDEKMKKEGKK